MTASAEPPRRKLACGSCGAQNARAAYWVYSTPPGQVETAGIALCESCTKKRREAFVEAAVEGSEMRVRSIDHE